MNKTNLSTWIEVIAELGKIRISLPVALSALTGYILKTGLFDDKAMMILFGVFMMASSSGAINHIQEQRTDALMPRTKDRPIPSGRIGIKGATIVALSYLAYGALILIYNFPLIVFLSSFLTLIVYNALYTPLKKITAFAVIPGALVGALPPFIGWFAGGDMGVNETILLVSAFFFIGQIPHFWLLMLLFGKEYALAGFPSLHDIFTVQQINRLSFTWILATIATAFVLAIKVINGPTILFILLIYIFYLLFSLSAGMFIKKEVPVRSAFLKLNLLYLLMMILLIVDRLSDSQ
jgi:protoheme IX farnesyltransferase